MRVTVYGDNDVVDIDLLERPEFNDEGFKNPTRAQRAQLLQEAFQQRGYKTEVTGETG